MFAHNIDQSCPLWFTQSCRDCNNDLEAVENNLFGCSPYVQYTLTCSKCKDSIVYQEKCQAIMDKVFHERFARHRVTLREEILAIMEVAN